MRLIQFIAFVFLWTQTAGALEPIRIPGIGGPDTPETALTKLKMIAADSRYLACKSALSEFVNSFSTADQATVKRHQTNFNGNDLAQWVDKKRKDLPKLKIADVKVNKNMESVDFSVMYDTLKCQISIYPKLEDDWIKGMVHPKAGDLFFKDAKSNEFSVSSVLVGSSTDEKKETGIQYDPSKVLSVLKSMDITDVKTQVKVLERFQEAQSSNGSDTHPEGKTPPPK